MNKIEITGHNINMSTQWKKEAIYRREESMKISAIRVKAPQNEDSLSITSQAKDLIKGNGSKVNGDEKVNKNKETHITLSEEDKQKIKILEAFLSKLTGKEIKIRIPVFVKEKGKMSEKKKQQAPNTRKSWQIEYKLHESYKESEKLSFSSTGKVKTADGKEIDFDVNLKMSREYAVENNVNLKISNGEPVDPLIINYSGKAADFKKSTFEFDLTADGSLEKIPELNPGSGYLVLSDDGKVEDGSELFGPETGNGFNELAKYDQDNNGWIDEGDKVFSNLKIWTKDKDGNDRLFALTDKDIGAIYLGNIDAPYSHKSADNKSLAVNKQLGLYLKESGQAGTIQEVDLIV
mgnify:FL=1